MLLTEAQTHLQKEHMISVEPRVGAHGFLWRAMGGAPQYVAHTEHVVTVDACRDSEGECATCDRLVAQLVNGKDRK